MLTKKKALMIILLTVFLLTISTIGAVSAASKNTKDVKDPTLIKKDVKTAVNSVKKSNSITNNNKIKKTNNKKVNVTKTVKTDTATKSKTSDANKTNLKKSNIQKNVKKADETPVQNYNDLKELLTSPSSDKVSVILEGDNTYEADGIIDVSNDIETLVIEGNNKIIDGKHETGFLHISDGTGLTINNITVRNMTEFENNGAVIRADGETNITLNNSKFENNIVRYYGGVIYQNSGNLTINNCTFTNNSVNDKVGGVIYQSGNSKIDIKDSLFKDNEACYAGGAIFYSNNLTVDTCKFVNNSALDWGGAICYNYNSDCIDSISYTTIINSNFTKNNATIGGAIYQDFNSKLTVISSNFTDNEADYAGGAILFYQNLSVDYCSFVNNSAQDRGGAISYSNGDRSPGDEISMSDIGFAKITNSKFTKNNASSGGAIYQDYYSNFTVGSSNFTDNSADDAGGAITYYQNLSVDYCSFVNNSALKGGAIRYSNGLEEENFGLDNGFAKITNSKFTKNNASFAGGAIYQDYNSNLTIGSSNFTDNEAETFGGAILYSQNLTVDACSFVNNHATLGGAIADAGKNGGLIYEDEAQIGYTSIINSNFTKNKADVGGALFEGVMSADVMDQTNNDNLPGNYITIKNSQFNENEAKEIGGAICLNNSLETIIDNVNFTGNKANAGGVIYTNNKAKVTLTKSMFTKNYAKSTSAIIYNQMGAPLTIEGNTFTSNWVGSTSGWVLTLDKNTKINNNIFINNTDNARDMLFDKWAGEVKGNKYIDNYLNDSFNTTFNTVKVDGDYTKDIILDLRDVYNDTIRNGTIKVLVNGVEKYSFNVKDGKTRITIKFYDFNLGSNDITLNYISLSKHYKNITKKFTIEAKMISSKIVDLTTSNSVKVGEKVTIKGVLVDKNNQIIPNAKLNINVNGNKYDVTTDKVGKFAKTIVSDTVGVNNVTVSFPTTKAYNSSISKTTFKVSKLATKINLNNINKVNVGKTVEISGKLVDENNEAIKNAKVTLTIAGKKYKVFTTSTGTFSQNYIVNTSGKIMVKATYSGDEKYKASKASTSFKAIKQNAILKVKSVTSTLGEKIKLTATLTDKKGNKVTGGNLVFKLNGLTFNEKKRFDNSSKVPYKMSVKNGKVTLTLTADAYLMHGGNITAVYSGSSMYNEASSNVAKLKLNLRNVKVKVKAQPSTLKQYQKMKVTTTLTDLTKNTKNKTAITDNAYLIYKIDGKTLKVKGKTVKTTVKSDKVTYTYKIPAGMAGIGQDKKVINHNLTAIYVNKVFSSKNNSDTTKFIVKRSKITVNINTATLKNNKLTVNGNIKDYKNNYVKGKNKLTLKINGKTYKVNGKSQSYTVKNGIINLKDIKIKNSSNANTVTIVTGQREAYLKGQSKATKIVKQKIVKQ